MICEKCGFNCNESDTYCNNCGASLMADGQKSPTTVTYKANEPKSPLSSNRVINLVKKSASSPLFLVMTVLFSLFLVLSLISIISNSYQTMPFDETLSQYLDASQIKEISGYIGNVSMIVGIVSLIPVAIIVAGMWMVFVSAINRKNDGMSTAGFTMIKAIMIFRLVIIGLIFVALGVFLIVLAIMGANYTLDKEITSLGPAILITICVAVSIFVSAVFSLTIIYYLKLLQTINTVKDTIITGVASSKVSVFAAVFSFVIAFGVLISSVVGGPLTVFKGIAEAAALILAGIVIITYHQKVNSFIVTQSVYGSSNEN